MNPTNDPGLRSFVPVSAESHFPVQNLPYGVFRLSGEDRVSHATPLSRVGVAIGEMVLDLNVLEEGGVFDDTVLRGSRVFGEPSLNKFMARGRVAWREARAVINRLLREDEPTLRDNADMRRRALVPMSRVEMQMPVEIGDYTDFYSSREHATNVGTMFRGKDNALMPNYLWMPVGYHGRASSVVLSGTDLHRPVGQAKADDADVPAFGPSRLVDFELEVGFFIGPGNELGRPVSTEAAPDHIFGLVLV
ncbi:MAG: fumarylacetoacetate hydrolase family protein, partial [Phycisphaerae bacterium]